MIEETAIVIDVKDQQALLQTQRKNACQSCSVKSGCGTSTLSKVVGKRSSQFVVENTLNLKIGDQVIVAIEENALVQGSLLIYLLPLIMMLGSGMLSETLFKLEWLTILSAVLGLLCSMFIVRFILKQRHFKEAIQPHLVRRV
mgnify:CR=1 FL=1